MGCAGYLLHAFGHEATDWLVPLGLIIVALLTALVLSGIRRSSASNVVIVSVTIASLAVFLLAGLPTAYRAGVAHFSPFFAPSSGAATSVGGVLEAIALMFVAYTGYGRIATLAEEVREPRRTIPLAIIITLFVSMVLYVSIGIVSVAAVGADAFAAAGVGQAAPLEVVADSFGFSLAGEVIVVGAVTAMLGVLLNLILGLSRVVLAIARRGEAPAILARVSSETGAPYAAVVLVACVIAGLVWVGDVKTTWSFSAFTVLVYYAITNLAALRLNHEERLYSPVFAWLGLASCLFLAFWVEPRIWMMGLAVVTAGLVWHWLALWRRAV